MTDNDIEVMVAHLLRIGVVVAGVVVATGGVLFLAHEGSQSFDYHTFRSIPAADRLIPNIIAGALRGRPRSIIQTGILLLIATPILRVAVSLLGFALEHDRKYVVITSVVLAILLYSLISGAVLS